MVLNPVENLVSVLLLLLAYSVLVGIISYELFKDSKDLFEDDDSENYY